MRFSPLLLLLVACARERTSVIDHGAWLMDTTDPFGDAPAKVDCPSSSFSIEGGVLEADTGQCNHMDLVQPSLVEVKEGDYLHVEVGHALLRGEGEGHMVVKLGPSVIYELRTPLPAEDRYEDLYLKAPADVDAGADVRFHVHNHGENTWNFWTLSRGPKKDAEPEDL